MIKIYKRRSSGSLIKKWRLWDDSMFRQFTVGGLGWWWMCILQTFLKILVRQGWGGYSLNGLIPWLGLFNPSLINEQTIVEIMPKMGGWSHQRASATVDIGWELMTSCSCFWSILVSPISHNHPSEDPSWIVRKRPSSRGGLSGKPQGKQMQDQTGTLTLGHFSLKTLSAVTF